jgi:hypothetical protein
MTFPKLITPRVHTVPPQLSNRTIIAAVLLLVSLGLFQSALAQNIQPRTVARLISVPVADARNSRPRLVTSIESSAGTTKSLTTNSPALEDANSVERRAFEQTNLARAKN